LVSFSGLASSPDAKIRAGSLTRLIPYLYLALAIALYLVVTFVWHKLDRSPVEFDQPMYYVRSLGFYDHLRVGDFAGVIADFQEGMTVLAPMQPLRPVLIPLISAVGYLLLGTSRAVAILTIAGFTTLLLVFCYLIAKEWAGWKAGVVAAVLTLSLPTISVLSKQYYFDVPLAAMVAGTIYLLIRKDCFSNPSVTIAAGLIGGIGMLCRETYLLFVVFPALLAFATFAQHRRAEGKRIATTSTWMGIAAGAAVLVLISAPFYLPRLAEASTFAGGVFGATGKAVQQGVKGMSLLDRWLMYTYVVIRGGITLPLFLIAFLSGAVLFWRSWSRGKFAAIKRVGPLGPVVAAWLFVPYIVSSISAAADIRYLLPALPAFAIILAVGVVRVVPSRLMTTALVLLSLYAVSQYLMVSFLPGPMRVDPTATWDSVKSDVTSYYGTGVNPNKYMAHVVQMARPQPADWRIGEILTQIDRLRSRRNLKKATVFILSYSPDVNTGSFVTEATFRSLRMTFVGPKGISTDSAVELMKRSEYIVARDKNFGEADVRAAQERLPGLPFHPTGQQFAEPDGSIVTIYERN
jgi:Dolichyl-phosphate-mannose-protein mannosyltransferase